MAETPDSVEETHRQTRGYVSGYSYGFSCFRRSLYKGSGTLFFLHVSDSFPFQESRISAVVNVCLCCGNAKFLTGNMLFRPFFWR